MWSVLRLNQEKRCHRIRRLYPRHKFRGGNNIDRNGILNKDKDDPKLGMVRPDDDSDNQSSHTHNTNNRINNSNNSNNNNNNKNNVNLNDVKIKKTINEQYENERY